MPTGKEEDVKIDAKVSDIRGLLQVGPTTDYKGNPVAALEILGVPVLYANPRDLSHRDWETWEEIVGHHLAAFLGEFLLGSGSMDGWQRKSPTGRQVRRLPVREEYDDDE